MHDLCYSCYIGLNVNRDIFSIILEPEIIFLFGKLLVSCVPTNPGPGNRISSRKAPDIGSRASNALKVHLNICILSNSRISASFNLFCSSIQSACPTYLRRPLRKCQEGLQWMFG